MQIAPGVGLCCCLTLELLIPIGSHKLFKMNNFMPNPNRSNSGFIISEQAVYTVQTSLELLDSCDPPATCNWGHRLYHCECRSALLFNIVLKCGVDPNNLWKMGATLVSIWLMHIRAGVTTGCQKSEVGNKSPVIFK